MGTPTPEELAEQARRDVMAYAYRDTDGKLYSVDKNGDLVEASGAKELSPEFQKIANQTAAIAITYRRIVNMSKVDRSLLADVMDGQKKIGDVMNKEVTDVWNLLKKQTGFEVPGSGIVDTLSTVKAGATVPLTFASDVVRSGSQFFDALFGHDLDHKAAVAIGTAYASAAQTASESHQGFEFSSIFDYAAAAAKWVVTLVCDQLGLDKEHALGWHKVDGSWDSLLAAEHRSGDNSRVAKEMTKLDRIGGVKTSELAILTTQDVKIEKKDGSEVDVNAANSDNKAIKAGDKQLTLEEAEAAAAGQKQPGMLDKLKKAASYIGFDETQQKFNEAGVVGTVAGVTVGASATGYAAHRTAVGFSETFVGQSSALSNAATETGNAGLAARTGKEVKAGKHVIKILSQEPDVAKGEALLSKARDLATKAVEREAAHPGMVSLGGKARQFESWFDVVKHPIDAFFQKSGSMAAKMVDVHVQPTLFGSTKAAYLNPINYPKIMIRNGMNIVHGFNEGLEGIASTSGKAPVMERIGTSLGKGLAWAGSKLYTPAVAETLAALPKNGLVTATVKSLGTSLPYADTALAGAEYTSALIEDVASGKGDYSKSTTATAKLGIIASCTMIGGSAGVVGGPFAPATCAIGAVGGALVGTGIWLFTGDAISNFFEGDKKAAAAPVVAPKTTPDAGLAAAAIDQHSKTKAAQASIKRESLVFSGTVLNHVGAVGDTVSPLLSAGTTKPREHSLVS